MDEKKNTPKTQTPSKLEVLKTSPVYELYGYLTLLKDNIPNLCNASADQLNAIAKQVFKDLNDLQLSISKLPADHCFTTKPILLPISLRQRFFLTPDAQCIFPLFKHCLEQTYAHLEAAPREEKSYPKNPNEYSIPLQKNIWVHATARRLFHCLTHTLSKQLHFIANEASIPDFLHVISNTLISRFPHLLLLTGAESACLTSVIMYSPQDWTATFRLTCTDFDNNFICCPLEDAMQLGWRRGITQLIAAGHQPLGENYLYRASGIQSEFPGWTLYQKLLFTTLTRHKAIRATLLTFFPPPLIDVVCEYTEEEPPPTSGCKLM